MNFESMHGEERKRESERCTLSHINIQKFFYLKEPKYSSSFYDPFLISVYIVFIYRVKNPCPLNWTTINLVCSMRGLTIYCTAVSTSYKDEYATYKGIKKSKNFFLLVFKKIPMKSRVIMPSSFDDTA